MTQETTKAPILSVEHGLLMADGKPVCTLIQLYTLFQNPVKLRQPLLFIDMGCAVNGEQSNQVP